MHEAVAGLDVGGANLKAAHINGTARGRPFPLWKNPASLPDALRLLLHDLPSFDHLAVTMTGELCDCYETKRQGVHAILDAVEAAAGPVPVRVWRNDGRLVDLAAARADPLPVAAANWLALATYAARCTPPAVGLLIDIGSTTTDLIPLRDGQPVPHGRTDPERLTSGELVYTGFRRTPVCALLPGLAAELFATTLDVYVLLGWLPEDAANTDTADGRPATVPYAHARLARMLCADSESCTVLETRQLARRMHHAQQKLIFIALEKVIQALPRFPEFFVLAGSGARLAREILVECYPGTRQRQVISLAEILSPDLSTAACAYAVAVLAAEEAHE